MSRFVFVSHLSPFLFEWHWLGHALSVRWYGLAYALGFLLTFFYFRRVTRLSAVPGFDSEALERLMIAVPVGVMLGGRLGFVAQHPHELLHDPLFVLRVWQGGMAFFGGLIGCLLALWWVARGFGGRLLVLTDIAVFPAALGLGFGRIANFLNGELLGKPTGGGWGVVFPQVDSVPRHPSQLYESASHFLLFGVLVLVSRRRPGWIDGRCGRLSFLFLTLYGLLRFLTDFYRADDTYWGPLSDGQWTSLLVGLVGLVAYSSLSWGSEMS